MALLLFDGFDTYKTSGSGIGPYIVDKHNGYSADTSYIVAAAVTPYSTGYAVTQTAVTSPRRLMLRLGAPIGPTGTFIGQVHFRPLDTEGCRVFGVFSGTPPSTSTEFQLLSTSSRLVFYKGTTALATGTTPININTWHYVRLKINLGTSGTALVMVGTNTSIVYTGNLAPTGTALQYIDFGGVGNARWHYDDLVVMDGSGTSMNDIQPELRVIPVLMGTNSSVQWTPSTGTSNVSMVGQTTLDDDTTYVYSTTSGHTDVFTLQTATITGSIYAVQLSYAARKDDVGTYAMKPIVVADGTTFEGDEKLLVSTYAYNKYMLTTNPASGSALTTDMLSTMGFGYKLSQAT